MQISLLKLSYLVLGVAAKHKIHNHRDGIGWSWICFGLRCWMFPSRRLESNSHHLRAGFRGSEIHSTPESKVEAFEYSVVERCDCQAVAGEDGELQEDGTWDDPRRSRSFADIRNHQVPEELDRFWWLTNYHSGSVQDNKGRNFVRQSCLVRQPLVRECFNHVRVHPRALERPSDLDELLARHYSPQSPVLQRADHLQRLWDTTESCCRFCRVHHSGSWPRSLSLDIPRQYFPNCCNSVRRNIRQLVWGTF